MSYPVFAKLSFHLRLESQSLPSAPRLGTNYNDTLQSSEPTKCLYHGSQSRTKMHLNALLAPSRGVDGHGVMLDHEADSSQITGVDRCCKTSQYLGHTLAMAADYVVSE